MLFDDLEQKEQLIGLLDDVRDAEGVRIFIGAETRLFSLSGSAVIAAPYMSGRQKVLGAIGVIGPARLNYARVIPLVDYTARALGRMHGRMSETTDMTDDDTPANDARRRRPTRPSAGRRRPPRRCSAEVAALKDQVLRYAAEAENTKRRAEREANDARAYAIQKFARDLLGVADNLAARPASTRPRTPTIRWCKNLAVGLEMTEKELLARLRAQRPEAHRARRAATSSTRTSTRR